MVECAKCGKKSAIKIGTLHMYLAVMFVSFGIICLLIFPIFGILMIGMGVLFLMSSLVQRVGNGLYCTKCRNQFIQGK